MHRGRLRILVGAFAAGFALVGALSFAGPGQNLAREGVAHYEKKDFEQAAQSFEKAAELEPASGAIQYDLGTALVQLGQYEKAAAALKNAIEYPGTPSPANAHYNLGLSHVKRTLQMPPPDPSAPEAAPPDPAMQLQSLRAGLEEFRSAIIADPSDAEAKHNFEVTKEMIRRLEEQMSQQQQQSPQPDSEKNESEQEQSQDQKSEEEQNSEQQDEQEEQNQNEEQKNEEEKSEDEKPSDSQNEDQNEGQQQQESGLEATPTPSPQNPSQNPNENPAETPKPELTQEQIDALNALNSLEKDNPEQFKRLFRFQGKPTGTRTRKDW
jgi:tetratricopeptide (TPR) repeat protein